MSGVAGVFRTKDGQESYRHALANANKEQWAGARMFGKSVCALQRLGVVGVGSPSQKKKKNKHFRGQSASLCPRACFGRRQWPTDNLGSVGGVPGALRRLGFAGIYKWNFFSASGLFELGCFCFGVMIGRVACR